MKQKALECFEHQNDQICLKAYVLRKGRNYQMGKQTDHVGGHCKGPEVA